MKKRKPMVLPEAAKTILKKGLTSPMPPVLEPMLATLVTEPVDPAEEARGEWVYEMKWDGFRAISYIKNGTVEVFSRNAKSFNEKFYPLIEVLSGWEANTIVDGEIVVLNEQGMPDFSALQAWRSEADGQLVYYIFDMLWLEGKSVMHLPLEERRKLLELIVPEGPFIRLSKLVEGSGQQAFEEARHIHLEGIMAKRKSSPYTTAQRTKDWLKIKTEKHQELVIGGYTINEGTPKPFSALLLGIMEGGKFQFVTNVGTGFNRKMQEELVKKLEPFETKECPFATVPEYNKPSRFRPNPPKATVTWVQPRLVAEISYRELTRDGAVRHPSYRGLREDKKPSEVKWELATDTTELVKEHRFTRQELIKAPAKRERKTLLNPKEASQTRPIGGHDLKFTNLDKLFWPKEGYTKRDMINYYYQIAPYMLPYMMNRPQTLNRHPNGIEGESFYQKDVKGKAPEWIETFPYYSYHDKRQKEFLRCTDEASLLYIASLGCIEMNPWHSRAELPDHPDWCIIDLDPDQNSFNQVIEAARVTKEILDAIGVVSFPKTSGSTGLHIYIPLGAKYTFHDSKEFGRALAKIVHAELPGFTSIERRTEDRGGQMYIDFLQNRPQATVAAPYSLRPKPGAPVSMPLHWEEVKKGLKNTNFHIRNAVERVRSEGDLFKGVLGKGVSLEKALKKMESLFGGNKKKVA